MYVCVRACMHACVHMCVYVCAGRDIISDKTKYMHSEDSDKLVYLSSLISLHLRLYTYIHTRKTNDTD